MRRLSSLVLALLVLCVTSAVTATTVVQMDLPDLISASDAIVVGEVSDVESRLHDDGKVYTHVRVSVDEVLKGADRETLRIVHIGGRVEGRATVVHGMPDFAEGEKVLLFLEQPQSVKHFVVTGLSQGKFELVDRDGTLTLEPASGDMALVKPVKLPDGDVKLERAESTDVTTRVRTLEQMREKITAMQRESKDVDEK